MDDLPEDSDEVNQLFEVNFEWLEWMVWASKIH